MQKIKSKIPERFHNMITAAQPSSEDIAAAQRELHIMVPSYISELPNMSDFKKKEITNRYVVNSVKHLIETEEKEAKKEAKMNTPMAKLVDRVAKKKLAMRAVVESAVSGEISLEEERILLESLRN